VIQLYRRTSSTQPFRKAGIPTTESDYYNARAKEEYQKTTIPPQRQREYEYVFIPFAEGEELPQEMTYEEAAERAHKP
jgi:hypothetical protein